MALLEKLLKKKTPSQEQKNLNHPMLGLSISAGTVKATIWELKDLTIEIIGLGVKNISESGSETNLDYKTITEKSADAIDIACQVAEVDVRECIFGVPQSWIENEQLLQEYDELTTLLAKNLDIEPIAYVSIPHAISYYLQYLHKTPPTAILIGTYKEGAQIAYVENGKIKEHTAIQWMGKNLGKNIDQGIMQLKTITTLPPALFLYGFGDLDAAQKELMQYNWTSSERFEEDKKAPRMMTNPKIIVLEEHADALAIALVGAKDYARRHNIQGRLSIKSREYPALNSQILAAIDPTQRALVQNAPYQDTKKEKTSADVEKITNERVSKTHEDKMFDEEQENNKSQLTKEVPYGFVVNKDIMQESQENETNHDEETRNETNKTEQEKPIDETNKEREQDQKEDTPQKSNIPDKEEKKQREQENTTQRKKINIPKKRLKKLLFPSVILLLISTGVIALAGWAYWNIPKAKVTVFVKSENLEKQITITASEKITEVGNNMIPARKIEIELQESKTASTSGKRATGQVAKGEVNIINKTGSIKTFNAGTELKTSNNQKFILTENVTVSSASAQLTDTGEIKTYGIQKVKVNAVEIGPQGNIPKDTVLTIATMTKDDYEAKAIADFTGGVKKDIKVVSSQDRNNLLKDLHADMEMKIPQTMRAKLTEDEILLEKAWEIKEKIDKFNKAVNDESDSITLNTTMKIHAYTIKKSDVENLIQGIATTAVPKEFELKDQKKDIRTEFVSLSKDGVVTLNVISKVNIIPLLDTKEIAKQIKGKQESAARQTIINNKKVIDVSFEYSINLPPPIATLPHKAENIEVIRTVR